MKGKHWLIFSGCLVSTGVMVSALHSWQEALSPAFVGGFLGVLGSQIAALYAEKVRH